LREDTQKLEEENTKLEGMVESHGELITEITEEIGLDCMGEDAEAKDDGGDVAASPVAMVPPPAPAPPTAAIPEEIIVEEDLVAIFPEQEAP
jgi:hypothetical protein